MEFAIIRPTKTITHQVNWIELESNKGNLVIMPGHAPTFLLTKPQSTVTWESTANAIESLTIGSGIVHVDRTKTTLIIDKE